MLITREVLEVKVACLEGADAFCKMFPEGYDTANWTLEEQLRIIRSDLRRWFIWIVKVNLLPLWSMRLADLYRADLSEADLSGADLSEADLHGAFRPEGLDGWQVLETGRLCK